METLLGNIQGAFQQMSHVWTCLIRNMENSSVKQAGEQHKPQNRQIFVRIKSLCSRFIHQFKWKNKAGEVVQSSPYPHMLTYSIEVEAEVLTEHVKLSRGHWWLRRLTGRRRAARIRAARPQKRLTDVIYLDKVIHSSWHWSDNTNNLRRSFKAAHRTEMGIRVDAIYGWTGNLKWQISIAVAVGEQSNQKWTNKKNMVLFICLCLAGCCKAVQRPRLWGCPGRGTWAGSLGRPRLRSLCSLVWCQQTGEH